MRVACIAIVRRRSLRSIALRRRVTIVPGATLRMLVALTVLRRGGVLDGSTMSCSRLAAATSVSLRRGGIVIPRCAMPVGRLAMCPRWLVRLLWSARIMNRRLLRAIEILI